ncbi:MAG: DUF742 domain-containing protein [Actinobacteria bacterium]|nr:DUF742 domain-containing protein [Actinomycetota bacterium]
MEEVDHNPRGPRHLDGPVVGLTGARFGGAAGRRSRATVQPPDNDDAAATRHHRAGQNVGLTGVRLPTILNRWRDVGSERLHQMLHTQEQHPEPQAADATRVERLPGQQQAALQSDITLPVPEPDWVDRADWDTSKKTCDLVQTYDLVRPYFWTGGRTASSVNLAVETLVSVTGRPADPSAPIEHRTILKLCATPHSVAELAALLKMPLGVARVVLGDLASAGNIAVHRTVGSADAASDVALMQRVLAGLQRL